MSAPQIIDEAVAARMAAALPEVSERILRQVRLESGIAITPMVDGVRQESLEHLERTLLALGDEYESRDAAGRRAVRQVVITSRRHANLAARNPKLAPVKRELKREMSLWMLTWLENPGVFREWVRLRKRQTSCLQPQDLI